MQNIHLRKKKKLLWKLGVFTVNLHLVHMNFCLHLTFPKQVAVIHYNTNTIHGIFKWKQEFYI